MGRRRSADGWPAGRLCPRGFRASQSLSNRPALGLELWVVTLRRQRALSHPAELRQGHPPRGARLPSSSSQPWKAPRNRLPGSRSDLSQRTPQAPIRSQPPRSQSKVFSERRTPANRHTSAETLQRQPGRPKPPGAVAQGAAPDHQTLAAFRQYPPLHLPPHRRQEVVDRGAQPAAEQHQPGT